MTALINKPKVTTSIVPIFVNVVPREPMLDLEYSEWVALLQTKAIEDGIYYSKLSENFYLIKAPHVVFLGDAYDVGTVLGIAGEAIFHATPGEISIKINSEGAKLPG
jgi:hypothetical protein